jgi:hypothetical protein
MVCCNHNASKQPGPSACSHRGPFALPTLIAMLLALLAGSPEPAGAATAQIGAVEEIRAAAPPAAITEGGFAVQASQSSGTYAVPPGYETITSWSHSAGSAAGSLTFKVYRPTGVLNEYTTVAFDTRVISAGSVQTFPVRIAVQPGDRLGLSSDAVQLAYETFDTGDRIGFFNADLTVGSLGTTIGEPFPEFKLDVAATLNTADINELPPPATVPPPPPSYGPPRPTLAVLRITPSAFAAARSGPSVRPARRTTPATLVSFTVSIASKVRFSIARLVTGRRRGSGKSVRCVATTRANRSAASCKREVPVRGSFTRTAKPGKNSFRFSGRVGGRRLARGSYRLIAVARANGVSSEKSRRAFRVVR